MGEVWRATDTQLNRDVALKILPEAFATDPDRLARFQREAQVLASLNHPGIAAIYGIEEQDETRALVLELVEGPTLADRISNGPIPLDEALPIAKQIAEALEAAHEAGVIHRDLKPANIKVREDGTVKVLDFGLAKALDTTPEGNPSQSPTLTAAATQMGVIMGTAAYMSPEQARGKTVDKRADIWSFGVVLFEMLTGQRAFQGEDVSLTLSAVLQREPEWETLPRSISLGLNTYLRRCLQKDLTQRVQAIGDVRLAMAGAFDLPAPEPVTQPETPVAQLQVWQRPLPAVVVVTALVVITGLAVWSLMRSASPAPGSPTRFTISPPASDQLFVDNLRAPMALSEDGETLVYVATRDGVRQLYRRPLAQLEALPIPGTEGARSPFFSPDGEWIGFEIDGALRRVAVTGGPTATLYEGPPATDASWGTNDRIVFGLAGTGDPLMQVASTGGIVEPVTTLEEGELDHRQPSLLPGGTALLFTVATIQSNTIAVKSLETGERRALFEGSSARYVSSGHLVFVRESALWAVPFDADQLTDTGEAVPVLEGVGIGTSGYARFAVAANGSLVYVPGTLAAGDPRTLVWVDPDGREEEVAAPPAAYNTPRLSPDGRYIAVTVSAPENIDVVVYELQRGTSTRLTFDPAPDAMPLWSPDSQRVLFASPRNGEFSIYSKAADGTGEVEQVTTTDYPLVPVSWSADGQSLVVQEAPDGSNINLAMVSLGAENARQGLVETEFIEMRGEVSPDGRWMAYSSDASGRSEVYVRPFPNVDDGRWQISREGGILPVWAADGQELFFRGATQPDMKVVSVETEPTFRPGNPEVLFAAPYRSRPAFRAWDVAADGRFLMVRDGAAGETTTAHMVVVQNWFEELLERVPIN